MNALRQHEIEFRVRYTETDAQARVHHANYISYFEMGRVELCRASGLDYRRMEEEGLMFVVSEIACRYYLPAAFDDLLRLQTSVLRASGARIFHEYRLYRTTELLATGKSTVACVDRTGRVRRLPDWLLLPEENDSPLA